jgi:hypothetical protein
VLKGGERDFTSRKQLNKEKGEKTKQQNLKDQETEYQKPQ